MFGGDGRHRAPPRAYLAPAMHASATPGGRQRRDQHAVASPAGRRSHVGALNLYSFGQSFSATDGNLKLREVGQSVAETGTW